MKRKKYLILSQKTLYSLLKFYLILFPILILIFP